ncbi:gephyrin-like molybdotransferase Glp [Candidatus Villigracilis saccharophilus]|uniref:molybdopterin molybdotransferase MoeA n=1 Tax=Candidatus Villigracilis saccharophilus TaxID=3140684 RepID=UPI0031373C45|nr:molybdopterin molybdenumtransferase MoeA [Anaerolineales bacterium]
MPEFLTLLPPDDARTLLLSHLPQPKIDSESIAVTSSLGRFTASDIFAPHPLPDFPRTTVDGYAVRARDTFGASDSLPAYLTLVGEVPMGDAPAFEIGAGQCALIHTGGMLPKGADAVVMLEYTQTTGMSGSRSAPTEEIEIFKSVADGENLIRIGEDVAQGQLVIPKGTLIRPAEIGGLMALGITSIQTAKKPRVGLLSTGDEVIDPSQTPRYGQVRDINSYTLGALVEKTGGEAIRYGIFSDSFQVLQEAAAKALSECDVIIITAGSSASTRDMTAEVIRTLGEPGVLVHGINTRPGKPTILGVCNGKAVIGLPGNPVSALVNGYLFVVPVIEKLLGALPKPKATVQAKLTVNLPSQAGREDWWSVKLIVNRKSPIVNYEAEPIFGKSNLIFTLASADGLLRIHPDATGLSAGEMVEVVLI